MIDNPENRKQTAEIKMLREALKPFADRANQYDGMPPAKYFGDTDFVLRYYDDHSLVVTLGECRAARNVLNTIPTTPPASPKSA